MTENSPLVQSTPPPAGVEVQDAAWARIPTNLSAEVLSELLNDAEALLRLNPYYHFKTLKQHENGQWHAEFENQSNQHQVTTDIGITRDSSDGLTLEYSTGIKKRTIFTVEQTIQGATLVVTDDYSGTSENERQARENEVDKSLLAWGESIRKYCLRLKRYSRLPGWRWYIRRVWIPMKPSGRRIVWLLALISMVEFAFFCFVLLIWVIEKNK